MAEKHITFTVDWEHYLCYLPYGKSWYENDLLIKEPTEYLLDLLKRHEVKAIFYCLGWLVSVEPLLFKKIKEDGHIIGDHTYYHTLEGVERYEFPFRAPRWKGEKRLYSGGFWFRTMPYWWVKREIEKTECFFIHPHDVMLEHPTCHTPWQDFKRQTGLLTARDKLERLMREVKFSEPYTC